MTECRPPPEHENHKCRWHWLRYRDATPEQNPWACLMWLPFDCWWLNGKIFHPKDAHEKGWDYVAPAIPPEQEATDIAALKVRIRELEHDLAVARGTVTWVNLGSGD